MNCPSCNILLIEGANFCHNCGKPLLSDPQLYDSNPSGLFTDNNATITQALKRLMPTSYVEKLLANQGRSEGERRIVTVLFSDIKGSTALSENLDPEEVLGIMNGAFDILIKPIMKYEGTLARLMGDAILAFFGAPIAHEDDPARACRAALEIIEGAKVYSRNLELEKSIKGFAVRVGINTGLVVVAEVGADLRVEYTAMGDAVNVASRMESAAEAGSILITDATKQMLPDTFIFEKVGPITVKGKSVPVLSYKLLKEVADDFHKSSEKKEISKLVGRKEEMTRLINNFQVTDGKKGKIISIIGECGFGKTRLVRELTSLTSDYFTWISVRSFAYSENNSYALIKNLLIKLISSHNPENSESLHPFFENMIKDSLQDEYLDVYPFIAYLLELPINQKIYGKFNPGDPKSLKGQIQYAVKRFLNSYSENRSIVILLEDLQWCDSSSLELLSNLFPAVSNSKLIFLLTFRKNSREIWDLHQKYTSASHSDYTSIELNPLKESDAEELLLSLSNDIIVPDKMKKEIIKRAGGNPLFIEEVLRSYTETELSERMKLSADHNASEEFKVPAMIQGVIMTRIDMLNPVDRMIIQSASVIGKCFDSSLLSEILADYLSEAEVLDSLSHLTRKELITPQQGLQNTENSFNHDYCFEQSLIQEVVYNSLLFSNREKLHLTIACSIEKLYRNQTGKYSESIGQHFEKGKDYSKSVFYYKQSAEKAKAVSSNKEALHFYDKVFELSKLTSVKTEVMSELLESYGDVNFVVSDYNKSIVAFESAISLITSTEKLTRLYQKCGQVYERWGQYDNSIKSYSMAFSILKNNKSDVLEARGQLGVGIVYYRKGNIDKAIQCCNDALSLLKNTSNLFEISEAYNNLGIIFSQIDRTDQAYNYHTQSLKIRISTGNLAGQAASYNNLGYLAQKQHKYEEAILNYNQSIEICEKIGNLHGLAKIFDNLSQIYISYGDNETAMAYSIKAMEILGRIALQGLESNQNVWLQSGVW